MADSPLDLTGRTVLVCGVRFAGESAARALLARGARVLLTDRHRTTAVDPLLAAGATFVGDPDTVPAGVELVVTSPGLRPDHPLLRDAAAVRVPVWGEIELAWQLRDRAGAPWLAVTGTNGKTTTVRMLESILLAAGGAPARSETSAYRSSTPCSRRPPYDVLPVEVSSFQLHWSQSVRPAAGRATEPGARSPGLARLDAGLRRGQDAGMGGPGRSRQPRRRMRRARCSPRHRRTPAWACAWPRQPTASSGYATACSSTARSPTAWSSFAVADVRPGRAATTSPTRCAPLPSPDPRACHPRPSPRGCAPSGPDPHRNQLVTTRDGVRWVDDSKATNPHAAAASLAAYPRVVWIAGGQLKDAPVDDLVARFASKLAGVVLLGVDREHIAAALARHAPDVPVITVATQDDGAMTEVVGAAAGLAHPGDTVLLAPAAASYDMFSGYAERGTRFAAAVAALGSR